MFFESFWTLKSMDEVVDGPEWNFCTVRGLFIVNVDKI